MHHWRDAFSFAELCTLYWIIFWYNGIMNILDLVNNFSIPLLVAVLTVAFGVLVKIVGFPDQMRKNYKAQSLREFLLHFMS